MLGLKKRRPTVKITINFMITLSDEYLKVVVLLRQSFFFPIKLYTSHNTNTLQFDEVTEKNVETRLTSAHGDAKYAYFVDQVTWEEAKAACNAIVEGDTMPRHSSLQFSAKELEASARTRHNLITKTLARDAESGGSTVYLARVTDSTSPLGFGPSGGRG